jgi:integrase
VPKTLAARPELSGKTVNNLVNVLREALEMAVLDKLLPDNPAAHVPSAQWQRLPVDPFTAEEVEAILADMPKRHPAQVANYTALKFFTGLRTGESFGLRWPNIDSPAAAWSCRKAWSAASRRQAPRRTRPAPSF